MLAATLCLLTALAQAGDPWADWSDAVEYGDGAGYGQDYYPANILGPPDPEATPAAPSSTPEELLTLGECGWVELQFTDNVVIDGPGADLTVFENVMELPGGGYFRECAFVEVSRYGSQWSRFPWDPVTLEGLAGVWPTTGEDPTNPEVSGGDQFDLADVGLDWISRVRLVDCGPEVADGGLFDLDAVVAVHWETGLEEGSEPDVSLQAASPFRRILRGETDLPGELELFSMCGRLLRRAGTGGGAFSIETNGLGCGVYLLLFRSSDGRRSTLKVLRVGP